jgi:hypothetical protein
MCILNRVSLYKNGFWDRSRHPGGNIKEEGEDVGPLLTCTYLNIKFPSNSLYRRMLDIYGLLL